MGSQCVAGLEGFSEFTVSECACVGCESSCWEPRALLSSSKLKRRCLWRVCPWKRSSLERRPE